MQLRRIFLLATVLVAALSVFAPIPATRADTPPDWGLGVFRGSGRADLIDDYEAWLGQPVSHVLDFVGRAPDSSPTPWENIDDPSWWCNSWESSSAQLVLSAAMLPNEQFSLAAGARGDYDAHWRLFARSLVDNGCADTIVRIGWEFNGKFYPWAAGGKEASYASYWRRIVTAMRSVAGEGFTFDWAPLAGNTNADVEAAYPGDAYVDLIGLDGYDTSTVPTSNPTGRWNDQLSRPYGLLWQDRFAKAHGKAMSLPEWGLTVRNADDLGGGDNPAYITRMWDWISNHDYLYASYFEVDADDADHRLMTPQFAKGGAEYRRLVDGLVDDRSPTSVTVSPGASSVLVSWTPAAVNNGAPATGYVVTPYLGSLRQEPRTFNDTATAHNVTGLTIGKTYTFTVSATNAIGTSPPSQRSAPVTVGSPGPPRAVTASPGATSALVTWAVPTTNNGSTITGYVVTPYLGSVAQAPRTFADVATAHNIVGLTAGRTYTFTVAAKNAAGTSAPSDESNPTTSGAPAAPANATATTGTGWAKVTWAPSVDNGAAITEYVVTPYVGYFPLPARTFSSTATTQTLTGLTKGTSYRFTVAGTNKYGTGPQSAVTNAITHG